MKTTFISQCCGQELKNGLCGYCFKACRVESVCADCLGSGEVTSLDYVYAGEPHMADVKIEVCACKSTEPAYV